MSIDKFIDTPNDYPIMIGNLKIGEVVDADPRWGRTTAMPTIKEIVKDNTARFSHYRDATLWYVIEVEGKLYQFPISAEEAKGGIFLSSHKAVTLMRWIRKAIDGKVFQPAK